MIVDCAVYNDGRRREGELPLEEAFEACRDGLGFVWIGLVDPTHDELDAVAREFELHELAVEDAMHAHQRPKLENYDDLLLIVLKTARYIDSEEVVEFGQILIFLGDGFIISVRHGQAGSLEGLRMHIEQRPDLLKHGPVAVLHAIVDRVVDEYGPVVEGVDKDIEEVETQVFSPERTNPAERIFKLKREVLEFHRSTAPLIDPLERLVAGRRRLPEEMVSYFRDVHDHAVRVNQQVEQHRELLTSLLQANLTQVSVRQNEDMRKISAWVAIIAVPTAIAGIYGMNFDHMPELGWELGYPMALAVMLAICSSLYFYFKRVGWL